VFSTGEYISIIHESLQSEAKESCKKDEGTHQMCKIKILKLKIIYIEAVNKTPIACSVTEHFYNRN